MQRGQMEELIVRISTYQKAMGYNFKAMSIEERMVMFRDYMVALQIEQAELAQELPIKPWRPIKDQKYSSVEIVAEEWIDCLFFLVDQALVLNLPLEALRYAFETKMDKNMNRIQSGYNNVKTAKAAKQGDAT